LALFLAEDGRVFGPTARTIWDRLIDLPDGLNEVGDEILGTACQIAFNCDPPFAFNSDPASVRNDGAETAGAEPHTVNRRPKLTHRIASSENVTSRAAARRQRIDRC